jgi:transposase
MLTDKLKPAISSKLLPRTLLLNHDNARPHGVAATIENIQKLNFEFLPYTPYSPDLATSDYHLVGSLKKALR